jgi:hypothetical protein
MANAASIDDEDVQAQDEEQGQDYRAPALPVGTPTPIAAPPRMVSPPAASPIQAPAGAPTGLTLPTPAEAEQRTAIRQMQYAVADMPLAQAEKAVNAALKFQAQRGYQRDIAGGMSAVDAMVKWGPTMFGSTAGSASALARVATAAQPEAEKVMNIGGVGYRIPAKGQAVRITPEAPAKLPPALATAYGKAIVANEQAIDVANPTFSPTTDALRNRNFYLRGQLQPVSPPAGVVARSGAAAPVAAPQTAAPVAAPPPTTVIRRTKDGRRAIFDASTKKFLRYADAP